MLACAEDVTIFTEYRNLLFTFHTSGVELALGRHKVLKVIRWALYPSSFNYRIDHVPGELNTMADIMTRWMHVYCCTITKTSRVVRLTSARGGDLVPTAPTDAKDWPKREQIRDVQNCVRSSA